MDFKPIWHYQPVDFGEPLQDLGHVLEQIRITTPVGGKRVRVLLDNRLNTGELAIDRIALRCPQAEAASWVDATAKGMPSVTLAHKERLWTDPVDLRVAQGSDLELRLWIRELRGLQGICQTWGTHVWQSSFARWSNARDEPASWQSCDQTIDFLAGGPQEPAAAVGISQVDVEADRGVRTIALFGDSITHMSYYGDALARRLATEAPGKAVLANAGLSGNRLCYDATFVPDLGVRSAIFGRAGHTRFESHLFSTMHPDVILMMEGINDVTHCFQFGCLDQTPTVDGFCTRYAEVIGCAHKHGSRILIGTIMPQTIFAEEPWLSDSEWLRRGINEWIMRQDLADGVMDFASVADGFMTDTSTFFLDGLHPNDRGGQEMAAIVPIGMLVP